MPGLKSDGNRYGTCPTENVIVNLDHPLGCRRDPLQHEVSASSHLLLLRRVAASAVALGLLVVLVLHLSYARSQSLEQMPANVASSLPQVPSPPDHNEYNHVPVGKETSVFDIDGLLKEIDQDAKDEEMVENLHVSAVKKLAEYHAIQAALQQKKVGLQDALNAAQMSEMAAREDVNREALEVAQVKSAVDATNATLQKFLKDVHDASISEDQLVRQGEQLSSDLDALHKREAAVLHAVSEAQAQVASSHLLVLKDTAAVNAAEYAVAATSGAAHARSADTSAQVKAAKAVIAAVKANQLSGKAHKSMLQETADLRHEVLSSVKTSLVALKVESQVSLTAVTGEHAQALHMLQQAQATLNAAKALHEQHITQLKTLEQLQREVASTISGKTSQLNGITSELAGLKQSIHTCTSSANDFQAKLNEQLKSYIQTLKKYQALRAVEEAAEAHLKLAHDALDLIQARSAKLEADEKSARAAADVAVKKLAPYVPARTPQQVSKASPSK
jgi:hypothetical protein